MDSLDSRERAWRSASASASASRSSSSISPHPSPSSSASAAAFGGDGGITESCLPYPPYPPPFAGVIWGVVEGVDVGVYDSPYSRGGGASDPKDLADMSMPLAAASSSGRVARP